MREKGNQYENMAKQFLLNKGLTFIQNNFQCRSGEIDLIMKDRHTLIFIEVRFRGNTNYGTPEETVTRQKQKRIISTAKHYLSRSNLWSQNCRFDVVAITPAQSTSGKHTISWHQAAFQ